MNETIFVCQVQSCTIVLSFSGARLISVHSDRQDAQISTLPISAQGHGPVIFIETSSRTWPINFGRMERLTRPLLGRDKNQLGGDRSRVFHDTSRCTRQLMNWSLITISILTQLQLQFWLIGVFNKATYNVFYALTLGSEMDFVFKLCHRQVINQWITSVWSPCAALAPDSVSFQESNSDQALCTHSKKSISTKMYRKETRRMVVAFLGTHIRPSLRFSCKGSSNPSPLDPYTYEIKYIPS